MSNDDVKVPQPQPQATVLASHARPMAFIAAVKMYVNKRKAKGVDVELVDVVVPRAYALTDDDHVRVEVPAGFQSMPKEWAVHWFSRANGVSPSKDSDEGAPKKLTKAEQKAKDIEDAMSEVQGGKVSDAVEQLPALSLEELQALLKLEVDSKNRTSLVEAIKAEIAKR